MVVVKEDVYDLKECGIRCPARLDIYPFFTNLTDTFGVPPLCVDVQFPITAEPFSSAMVVVVEFILGGSSPDDNPIDGPHHLRSLAIFHGRCW